MPPEKFFEELKEFGEVLAEKEDTKKPEVVEVEPITWHQVMPDRADVDSWATRLGVSGILTALSQPNLAELISGQPAEVEVQGHAAGFVTFAFVILSVITFAPIVTAYNKTISVGDLNRKSWKPECVQFLLVAVMLATAIALFPGISSTLNLFFTDITVMFSVYAVIAFALAILFVIVKVRGRRYIKTQPTIE